MKIFNLILICFVLQACGGEGDAEQRLIPAFSQQSDLQAKRKLALDGADNFRDLGGYLTADGRRVKWGVVYRSDSLADLSDEDIKFLQRLKLEQVVDFRTEYEKQEDPDRIPEGVRYIQREVDVEGTAVKELFRKITEGDIDDLNATELMENANRAFVKKQSSVFGAHLRSLTDASNLPSVAHCTGGKDRAGFAAAITLLALGVPEETVIKDFMLTNEYTKDKIQKYIWTIRLSSLFQTDPEKIRPLLGVEQSFIEAALDEMKKEYGSIDNYIRQGLGMSDADILKLKDNLLES